MKTRFEKLLEESIQMFYMTRGKPLTLHEVMNAFFPQKFAKFITEYRPNAKKNAVVLVGPSCSGKTTFALNFVKEHPDFVLVSMDECAAKELETKTAKEVFAIGLGVNGMSKDDLGNRRFGQMLEAGHKNIIVDGNWMHINSRGALLRALDAEGYNTTLFMFYPTPQQQEKRIRHRLYDVIASERTGIRIVESLKGVDILKKYADMLGVTVDKAKRMIEQEEDFAKKMDVEIWMLTQELKNSNIQPQIDYGVLYLGADQLFEVAMD